MIAIPEPVAPPPVEAPIAFVESAPEPPPPPGTDEVSRAVAAHQGSTAVGPEVSGPPVVLGEGVSETIVRVDKRRLVQVLANLLENAFKYSPAETNVTVRLVKMQGLAVVSVQDSGEGIALAEQEREGAEDHRFARARLPGDGGEAGTRLPGKVLDEGEVADAQGRERCGHGRTMA